MGNISELGVRIIMIHLSDKTKKILPWIPLVNVVTLFLRVSTLNKCGGKKRMRAGVVCCGIVMASALIQISVTLLVPEIQKFSGIFLAYFALVALNLSLLRLQTQKDEKPYNTTDNKKKKLWIFVVAGVAILAVLVGGALYRGAAMQIGDQNGPEDTSLAVLSQEDIVKGGKCTMTAHIQKKYGNASQVSSKYDDVDGETVSHTFGKVSGVCTVHATKTSAQTLTLTITSTLVSGNMELAVIVDGEHYCNVPINQTMRIVIENVRGKTVFVRLGGESAKAEVSVSRSCA